MDPKNSLLDGSHNSAMHQRISPSSSNTTSTSSNTTFSEEEEANLSKEINRSLSLLSDLINTKMAPAAERTSKSQQHSLLVKRYREILFDSTADFQKTANGLSRRREQLQLFRGAAAAIQGNGSGEG